MDLADVRNLKFPVNPVEGDLPQVKKRVTDLIEIRQNYSAAREKEWQEALNAFDQDLIALMDIRIKAAKTQGAI